MLRLFDEWLLLPQRIALHEPTATAVLADVHLGYAKVRQQLGDAIPCRSTEEEMQPLANAAQTHEICQLIVAGDLFERGFDAAEYRAFVDILERLRIRFLGLAPGNHDRGVAKAVGGPPLFPDGYELAGWRIVHGDERVEAERAVMGHWHPALRSKGRKHACFLAREGRLILPAFSLDAAGVDMDADSRWSSWQRYAILDDQAISRSAAPTKAKARGSGHGR